MIEGLSLRGQQVMSHAAMMAKELGHPTIETEHILLGIALIAGPGQEILKKIDLRYDSLEFRIRSRLSTDLGPFEREPVPGVQLRRILAHAKTEAADSNSTQIDTDHMLLAISRDPGCTAMCIMGSLLPPCNLRTLIREASDAGELAST